MQKLRGAFYFTPEMAVSSFNCVLYKYIIHFQTTQYGTINEMEQHLTALAFQ